MIYIDRPDHPPAHFHARYGEHCAQVALDGSGMIEGDWSPWSPSIHCPSIGAMLTVTSVTLLGGFGLRLEFSDGVTGDVDCSFLLDQGLGTALRDAEHFRQVAIDTELGTVVWPNDLDPAPSVMRSHAEISAISSAA